MTPVLQMEQHETKENIKSCPLCFFVQQTKVIVRCLYLILFCLYYFGTLLDFKLAKDTFADSTDGDVFINLLMY